MFDTLISTAPIYIAIFLGVIFNKYKILPDNAKTIGVIAFKIVLPALIFNVLYGLKFTNENIGLLVSSVVIIFIVTIGIYVLAKSLKLDKVTTGTIVVSGMGFAIGSFAFPFIQLNFVNEVFQNVVLIDVILFLSILTIGYAIAVYYGDNQN